MAESKSIESPFVFVCSNVEKLDVDNKLHTYSFDNEPKRLFDIDYDIDDIVQTETDLYGSVILHFNIFLTHDDDCVMRTHADIRGVFKTNPDTDKDVFKQMLVLNGVTALYGISRGILTSISSVAFSNEIIRLPMININRLIELKHSKLD